MIVSDDVTGTSSSYLVTRDGPIIDQDDPENSDGTYNVDNTTFEPQNSEGNYKGVPLEYPEGMGAYALRNRDGSNNLKAAPNNSPFRQKKDEAKGVMIHVGGQYTDSKGRQRITGSEGCFSLAGKDSGNKGIKKFTNDVYKRQQANKKANKGDNINIKVEKRKKVDNEWEVDKTGNKTK
jgi:hypothetical protein